MKITFLKPWKLPENNLTWRSIKDDGVAREGSIDGENLRFQLPLGYNWPMLKEVSINKLASVLRASTGSVMEWSRNGGKQRMSNRMRKIFHQNLQKTRMSDIRLRTIIVQWLSVAINEPKSPFSQSNSYYLIILPLDLLSFNGLFRFFVLTCVCFCVVITPEVGKIWRLACY